ncbi:MAG: tetratricopeptide repeat protein [Planctomycetota bacterium]
MDKDAKNEFDKASKTPTESEVFAKEPKKDLAAQDVFVGDKNFYNLINKSARGGVAAQAREVASKLSIARLSATHIILIINTIVITTVLLYLVLKEPVVQVVAQPVQQIPPGSNQALTQIPNQLPTAVESQQSAISKRTIAALDKASSWQLAEQLYANRNYSEAAYVFEQLSQKLPANTAANEFMRDFFRLKMAVCLQHTREKENLSALFTEALASRSPLVRALANYHLIFVENRNKKYLNARSRAYRTIALLKAFDDKLSPTFEADCYFMLAEALTRQVMLLNNAPDALPGQLWADTLPVESIAPMSQNELREFVQAGIEHLSMSAVTPKVQKREHLGIGAQWSLLATKAPLEEVLARFASAANLNIIWTNTAAQIRKIPTTLYLPTASEQLATEVAAGTAGLIAHFDGDKIKIHDADAYTDLSQQKQLLTAEAISAWRRFLLRYRGDHRTANTHYAIALLHDFIDDTPTALGEYRLVASGYPHNPLAPFALLNASKIKTNIRDYAGAREDLNEILIQYPECKLVDQASLYLAQATLGGGLYDEAIRMFQRVYNYELNAESQCGAAYGLGKCFFETKQYQKAAQWLKIAINSTDNDQDYRLQPAYFMLGKANVATKDFENASLAFRNALENSPQKKEYIEVTLELIRSEFKQENYVVALNILESIPVSQLSQEYSCQVLIAKARILRELGLTDTAISLLRRRIEFVADALTRARLNFELAGCFAATGDLLIAQRKLTNAILDLPPGLLAQQANLFLAELSMKLDAKERARDVCLQLLRSPDIDVQIQQDALNLLGRVYAGLNQHNNAALAYAGIFEKMENLAQ